MPKLSAKRRAARTCGFVPVKSPAQQSVLVLHRMRTGFVEERTALVNRLRGLLAEFGVFLPQGIRRLHEHLIERIEDGSNELTGPARLALLRGGEQWQVLDEQIAWLDRTDCRACQPATRRRNAAWTCAAWAG